MLKQLKTLRAIPLFLAAAAAAAYLVWPGGASAAYRRYDAAFCAHGSDYVYANGGALANTSTSYTYLPICPVIDDSTFAKSAATGVNVHVYDNHNAGSVEATACVQYYGTAGASCGTTQYSSSVGIGNVMLTPSISVWLSSANAAHFPYVAVQLREMQSGRQAKLFGYYVY